MEFVYSPPTRLYGNNQGEKKNCGSSSPAPYSPRREGLGVGSAPPAPPAPLKRHFCFHLSPFPIPNSQFPIPNSQFSIPNSLIVQQLIYQSFHTTLR
ncbi:MAG: hypothetical protein F6K31_28155 [Symploca sp. SIO2G7]|nr:hypothetical protein [Symploca sp. SIO2G7]